MTTEVATTTRRAAPPPSLFSTTDAFEQGYRIARALTSSALVPTAYRGEENVPNAMIAMDMANRIGVSAIVVMQNLHVIEGRPSWSSPFIISALNSCGLFSPIRFRLEKLGEQEVAYTSWEGPKGSRQQVTKKTKINEMSCIASAVEKETGEILEGPPVTIAMAVKEGWFHRNGSKWVTMPELMIRYRAAAFFGRLYAPHILNGMPTDEEAFDVVEPKDITPPTEQPSTTSEEKPAGRPRGIHAAMSAGKAEPEKTKPKKAAPKIIEAEADENQGQSSDSSVDETQTTDTGDPGFSWDNDIFLSPEDDDDYNPA